MKNNNMNTDEVKDHTVYTSDEIKSKNNAESNNTTTSR